MGERGKDAAQRILAIIVIVAMLLVMQIPLPVIVFFAVVTYFIWRAVQRSEYREIGRVFEFYIAAHEILDDEKRCWFGFEVAEVVEEGERLLCEMPDAPPLIHYALGALYHRSGEYGPAAEHLSYLLENERGDESRRFAPSPELRRYAGIVRKIEREPTQAPLSAAALHNLEAARRQRAAELLADSRAQLGLEAALLEEQKARPVAPPPVALGWSQPALSPPPPISEVLRHVYEEDYEDRTPGRSPHVSKGASGDRQRPY
jgi:hypothetical protein